jgi:hypothetical protein
VAGGGDMFTKGRDFGAWLGMAPKLISSRMRAHIHDGQEPLKSSTDWPDTLVQDPALRCEGSISRKRKAHLNDTERVRSRRVCCLKFEFLEGLFTTHNVGIAMEAFRSLRTSFRDQANAKRASVARRIASVAECRQAGTKATAGRHCFENAHHRRSSALLSSALPLPASGDGASLASQGLRRLSQAWRGRVPSGRSQPLANQAPLYGADGLVQAAPRASPCSPEVRRHPPADSGPPRRSTGAAVPRVLRNNNEGGRSPSHQRPSMLSQIQRD